MSSKKNLLMLCVVLVFTVLACSCGDVIVEPKWIIGIKGTDNAVFSSLDYAKLSEVTITVEKEQQDGTILEETWEGVYLRDVVDYLGITEYSSITLTSSDDYSIEYSPDVVNDPLTILGTNVNSRDLNDEDGYVQAVTGHHPESLWVKKLSKITIEQ